MEKASGARKHLKDITTTTRQISKKMMLHFILCFEVVINIIVIYFLDFEAVVSLHSLENSLHYKIISLKSCTAQDLP